MTFTLSVHKHSQPQMDSKPNLCYETIHLAEGQMRLFLLKRHWTSVRRLIKLIWMWSRYWAHISACVMNTCVVCVHIKHHINPSISEESRRLPELHERESMKLQRNIHLLTVQSDPWFNIKYLMKLEKNGLKVSPSTTTTWCVKDDFFFQSNNGS